jgi:hypothetical protein
VNCRLSTAGRQICKASPTVTTRPPVLGRPTNSWVRRVHGPSAVLRSLLQTSSLRSLSGWQERAITASAPGGVRRIPDCLSRRPTTVLGSDCTPPEVTKSLWVRKCLWDMRSDFLPLDKCYLFDLINLTLDSRKWHRSCKYEVVESGSRSTDPEWCRVQRFCYLQTSVGRDQARLLRRYARRHREVQNVEA